MVNIIAVVNQKGGVAKTTTTIHLGVALAQLGKKVLLVDLDSQGHLAEGFGIVADNLKLEMSDVFEGSKSIRDIIIPEIRPHLDLAPSNVRLADMELPLVNMRFRESKLKRALEAIVQQYDYILLDCPPNLGLFTVNALIAANNVLIPMATHFWSMLGVSRLLTSIQAVKQEANPALAILGIIPTRFTRTVHAREVIDKTKAGIGTKCHIFEYPINESVRFAEATGQGKTIFDIAPDIEGAHAYREIAKEIIHA
ncbi:MAG: ParA family protein [Acidobacteria bacterium]|nr:ParA family protein [Acidobacteriota bacterium]